MEATPEYEAFLSLLKTRMSVRRFKPDPVPSEHIERILEAGRWAMSGANAQPWEFVVVTEPEMRKELHEAYVQHHSDFSFWMEQLRRPELRHPTHQLPGSPREQFEIYMKRRNWSDAPALIVVLGDGRKQWGTTSGGLTFGRNQTHFTDALANASQVMHLAAASLGLGSQWVTINIQEPFKRILSAPDLLTLYIIIPVGYPAVDRRPGYRNELDSMAHYGRYDAGKFLSNEQVIDYIHSLRQRTVPKYATSFKAQPSEETKE